MSIHLLRSAPLGLWVLSASFPRGCAWRSGQSHPVSTGNLALSACIQFAYISGLFLAWTWTLKIVVSTGYIIFRTHVSSFLAGLMLYTLEIFGEGCPNWFFAVVHPELQIPSKLTLSSQLVALGSWIYCGRESHGFQIRTPGTQAASGVQLRSPCEQWGNDCYIGECIAEKNLWWSRDGFCYQIPLEVYYFCEAKT